MTDRAAYGKLDLGMTRRSVAAAIVSLAALAPCGMLPAAASNIHNVEFGFGAGYDSGGTTSLSLNANHNLLEVHQSQGGSTLWYSVGATSRAGTSWASTGIQYDSGITPSCALNDNNVAVEVHETNGLGSSLWYHVGTLSGSGVSWGGSHQYDNGANPSVALNNSGKVVEVHKSQSNSGLWYHVGTVSGSTISWGGSVNYDNGAVPQVAINNSGTVVEVHQSQSANTLWYHVGTISGSSITWGPSVNYTNGTNPSVALTDSGEVVEVHDSGSGTTWQNTGYVSGNSIVWNSVPSQYDSGSAVSVAAKGSLAVQSTVSGSSLLCSSSLLLDRASWMENGLGVIGNRTLAQIAMPGSHDAGMYDNSLINSLAETQDMTINQQLFAGVRYFDLRPHWTGSDLVIYHGPIQVESVQTVLSDVLSFMQTGRKELVVLKFSHYDGFDSSGVAYQTLTSWIHNTLGSYLYTSRPAGTRLASVTLNQYLSNGGKVLVVCDGSEPQTYPSSGVWVYRDWSSGDPQNGDLTVFDQYANVTDYATMKNDQFAKFSSFNGTCQNNASVPCDLFLLSWTLTPAVDVWAYVNAPDANLGNDINTLTNPNASGKIVNIVYTDYNEYSRSVDVCEYLNGIAN